MFEDFSTTMSDEDMILLFKLGSKYGVDPLSSIECEQYFINLLKQCENISKNKKEDFLRETIATNFISNTSIPNWIQSAEWQFDQGKPMVFVGQIEFEVNRDGRTSTSSFYVFWNMDNGKIKTIMQTD